MSLPDKFLYEIFRSFIDSMNQYAAKMVGIISGDFTVYARALVALYIAIIGFQLIQGKFERKNDIITSIILITVLHAVIIESDLYFTILKSYVKFITASAGYFIDADQGLKAPGKDLQKMFNVFGPILGSAGRLVTDSGANGVFEFVKLIPMRLLALIAFILVIVCFIIYLALCLLALFGIYLFFLIGAVPIFFASFKETRHIFFAWLKGLLCDGLTILIASIFLSVCLHGLRLTLDGFIASFKADGSVLNFSYINMVIYTLVTCGILLKSPDYASNLSGSSSGSSANIAGGIGIMAGKILYGSAKKAIIGGAVAGKAYASGDSGTDTLMRKYLKG